MLFISSFLLMAPQIQVVEGSIVPTIIYLLLLFLFLFLMIRPQQKRQKEHQQILASLKVGDKVVTTAGLYGKIDKLDEKTVVLQVENAKLTFDRASIVSKVDN